MPSNQKTQNPALDIEYAFIFVVICIIAGYLVDGTAFGLLFGILTAILYLLYRIWWSLELVAAQL